MRKDKLAYKCTEDVLDLLKPKVIVVCHCDGDAIKWGLPTHLCSSTNKSGTAEVSELRGGHTCIKIYSYHPMWAARTEETKAWQKTMHNCLFIATVVVASNALVGRQVSGFGLSNLKQCATRRPSSSFAWIGPGHECSEELLRYLDPEYVEKVRGVAFDLP